MFNIPITFQLLNINFNLPFEDPVLIFSVVLAIILLAPILLRKLRIPSIIGLIIAGVAIGPDGFKILAFDSSIKLFGMVGLLYLMFQAGLDLEMNEFRKSKNKSIFFGLLTFSIPFGIGVIACHYVFHFDIMASALISSMFATHTLVAYPITSKLGITKNEAVTIAIGGTIITDTLVLLLLAVITGAQEGTLNQAFWIQLVISIIIFVLFVFLVFPPVGRWFFKNIKEDNTTQYIFVLAMVFFAGLLAELAGMEAIIGAFMAGLALNRLIPATSPLMNRIEFVGNTIFIPFFLISVGMRVDLKAFLNGPSVLILAGVLLLVAIGGKWIAAWITQKLFNYSKIQRNVLFGLTTARAAATLAVILVGYQIGIIDETVLNGTIILILITCLISSFITESSGRKLALEENEVAPDRKEEEQERILVPISNPDTIEKLIDFAVMLKNKKSPDPIYSLTIVKDNSKAEDYVPKSNKMQEDVAKHASGSDSNVKSITRIDLSIVSGISRAMKEITATDLVMGWSKKISAIDRLFGTTVGSLTGNVWKNIYITHFVQPINTANRMRIVLPKHAEYEIGFNHIVEKINAIAIESGVSLDLYCTEKTHKIFIQELDEIKSSVKVQHHLLNYLEDLYLINKKMTKNDLLFIVSARKKTISYEPYLDYIPSKLNKYFSKFNFILMYPEQKTMTVQQTLHPDDINLLPIQEQLENFTRLSRAVKRMLHPNDKEEGKEEEEKE